MKKIILTATMALALMSTNAMNVNNANLIAERMNSNDSLKYEMYLNGKMNRIEKSFHLDELQKDYLLKVQDNVATNFDLMNTISDKDKRNVFMGNLLNYWKNEAMNAFSMTARNRDEWMSDYKNYWKCARQTIINRNYK